MGHQTHFIYKKKNKRILAKKPNSIIAIERNIQVD